MEYFIFDKTDMYVGALVVLALLTVVLVVLLVMVMRRFRRLSAPVYDYVVRSAEQEAERITAEARDYARTIRAEAETQVNEYIEKQTAAVDDSKQYFESELSQFREHATTTLNTAKQQITDQAASTAGDITQRFEQAASAAEQKLDSTLEGLSSKTQQQIEQFSSSLDEINKTHRVEVRNRLKQKITEAEKAIDTYRAERLALVDREIAMLVERTTELVLGKKLTTEEHAELITDALEEAKSDGVFTSKE